MDEEKQFQNGFNRGYLLAKHEPNIASQITARPNDHNPFFQGLVGGKEQYELEVREWSKSFSRDAPAKENRETDRER